MGSISTQDRDGMSRMAAIGERAGAALFDKLPRHVRFEGFAPDGRPLIGLSPEAKVVFAFLKALAASRPKR